MIVVISLFDICDLWFLLDRNECAELAQQYKAINFGQGFSDGPVPKFMIDALNVTINNPNYLLNQYARGFVSNLLLRIDKRPIASVVWSHCSTFDFSDTILSNHSNATKFIDRFFIQYFVLLSIAIKGSYSSGSSAIDTLLKTR